MKNDICKIRWGYDDCNLISNSQFRVRIAKNVYWVPFNVLGHTRYTFDELQKVTYQLFPNELQKMHFNVYEAIQLFRIKNFKEKNDIDIYICNNTPWQLHKSGKYAVETNCGYCASAAAWLNYIVDETYPNKGYLHILRPNGSGHVVNYIYVQNSFYIIDMLPNTNEYALDTPREDGKLSSYLKAKFISGVCYECSSLMDYIYYHRRLQKTCGYEFTYSIIPKYYAIPPCYSEFLNGKLFFHYTGTMKQLFGNFTCIQHDWGELGLYPVEYTDLYI